MLSAIIFTTEFKLFQNTVLSYSESTKHDFHLKYFSTPTQ